jgi:hypothetical protein
MAGVGIGPGGAEDTAGADDSSNAGDSGADGANVPGVAGGAGGGEVATAAQLSKLQLQLALLQERINSKVRLTGTDNTPTPRTAPQQGLLMHSGDNYACLLAVLSEACCRIS